MNALMRDKQGQETRQEMQSMQSKRQLSSSERRRKKKWYDQLYLRTFSHRLVDESVELHTVGTPAG